jgi:hypothetical protein
MSSGRIDSHPEKSSGSLVVRQHSRTLRESAGNGTPLDLAEDQKLSDALRRCEHAFNEDVLPPRTRLEEPREFYAAAHPGCMPHGQDRASRRQIALRKASALLPDVAA